MYFTQGYWLRLFTNDAEVMQTFGECMPFVCLAVMGYRQAQGRRVCTAGGRAGDGVRGGSGKSSGCLLHVWLLWDPGEHWGTAGV